MILNLGCGKTKIPGAIGVDRVKIEGFVDVVHNLNVLPYPFRGGSVDEIHLYHVLEHFHDPIAKLEELYRILKPGGLLYVRVPHFSSMAAFTDLTHIRPFGYLSFDCLEQGHYHHFYTKVDFVVLLKEIKYLGLYPNSGIYAKHIHPNQCPQFTRPFVRMVNFLIKLSPIFFERVWCYWVGGAAEISLVMKKAR